ncbi:hypothetical protein PM082_023682 [Marasmius tenuissimus]|nr:hypothetical protein PM082_023682 [Marasmius tenuissimus]
MCSGTLVVCKLVQCHSFVRRSVREEENASGCSTRSRSLGRLAKGSESDEILAAWPLGTKSTASAPEAWCHRADEDGDA